MAIKLIVTDLDGTFLSDFYQVSEKNIKAVRAAKEKGVMISACTTRNWAMAKGVVRWGELNGLAACCNGASFVRVEDGFVINRHCLPRRSLEGLVRISLEYEAKIALYSHEQTLMEPTTSPMHYLMIREDWPNHIPPLRIPVTKCDTIDEMVILGREDTQLLEVFSKDGKPLPAEWAERIHAQGNFHIAEPNQGCYHVSFAGASKLKAAQALARQLRLKPEEVMCLGDAYSDSEMIQWAGVGVAMGNAEEGIKPLADFVLTGKSRYSSSVIPVRVRYPESSRVT
mgnify:CR=1 FL=1